jgi:hypothetical protein
VAPRDLKKDIIKRPLRREVAIDRFALTATPIGQSPYFGSVHHCTPDAVAAVLNLGGSRWLCNAKVLFPPGKFFRYLVPVVLVQALSVVKFMQQLQSPLVVVPVRVQLGNETFLSGDDVLALAQVTISLLQPHLQNGFSRQFRLRLLRRAFVPALF